MMYSRILVGSHPIFGNEKDWKREMSKKGGECI